MGLVERAGCGTPKVPKDSSCPRLYRAAVEGRKLGWTENGWRTWLVRETLPMNHVEITTLIESSPLFGPTCGTVARCNGLWFVDWRNAPHPSIRRLGESVGVTHGKLEKQWSITREEAKPPRGAWPIESQFTSNATGPSCHSSFSSIQCHRVYFLEKEADPAILVPWPLRDHGNLAPAYRGACNASPSTVTLTLRRRQVDTTKAPQPHRQRSFIHRPRGSA